jgi:hypothetical protein
MCINKLTVARDIVDKLIAANLINIADNVSIDVARVTAENLVWNHLADYFILDELPNDELPFN